MIERVSRFALLALAAAASACATGPRPAEVTRFHLNQPIAPGAITLRPLNRTGGEALEFQSYAAAVGNELTRLGFSVAPQLAKAELIATVNVERGVRPSIQPRSSPVSIGIGGGSYGGGVGIGVGTSFGLGKSRSNDTAVTTLAVQIKRASDESVIWEGRAVGETQTNASPGDEIARLAAALFKDFPGVSGQTVEVR